MLRCSGSGWEIGRKHSGQTLLGQLPYNKILSGLIVVLYMGLIGHGVPNVRAFGIE